MRKRVSVLGVLVGGLAFCGATASAETIEEVSKKIAAATEKLNSYSAKTKTVTEMKQEGFSMVSTAETATEMLRKGADFLVRSETKSVSETTVGGNASKQETSMLMVNDGAFMYTVSDMAGTKMAQKHKIEKPDPDPMKIWKGMGDLKVLPDATVDGRAAWVIELTPKAGQGGAGKSVMHFDKETGQLIKMVAHSPDGKPMTTMTCSDIKVNPKLEPDRFVFKAPPGVEVQDMTR